MNLIGFLIICACTGTSTLAQEIVWNTTQGQIRGLLESTGNKTVYKFLNIPYAKPPMGNLRFQKPQSYGNWHGVLDGTKYGPSCPQVMYPFMDYLLLNPAVSEDCLQVNIYVAGQIDQSTASKAVMVWIHGGGFDTGQAQLYDGTPLATVGDVIVVTVNYRLGILGFLTFPDEQLKGNYGLWDQIMALQWVRDNIHDYGGDPNNVTLFGESAGAMSVSILSLVPAGKSLFQKVILQSGVANSFLALKDEWRARNTALEVIKLLNCSGLGSENTFSCLQNKSIEEIVAVQSNQNIFNITENGTISFVLPFAPVIDSDLIPVNPDWTLHDKSSAAYDHFRSLDIMVGTCSNEGSLLAYTFLPKIDLEFPTNSSLGISNKFFKENIVPVIASETITNSSYTISKIVDKLTQTYFGNNLQDQALQACYLFNDAMFLVPTVNLLNIHANESGNANTYQYLFNGNDLSSPLFVWFKGTPHATDLFYLFDIHKFAALFYYTLQPEDVTMANDMLTRWTNFAKTGNPNSGSTLYWPKYDQVKQQYINFSSVTSINDHVSNDRIRLWLELQNFNLEPSGPVSCGFVQNPFLSWVILYWAICYIESYIN